MLSLALGFRFWCVCVCWHPPAGLMRHAILKGVSLEPRADVALESLQGSLD